MKLIWMETNSGWWLIDRRHNVHAVISQVGGRCCKLVLPGQPDSPNAELYPSVEMAKVVARGVVDMTIDPFRFWALVDHVSDWCIYLSDNLARSRAAYLLMRSGVFRG